MLADELNFVCTSTSQMNTVTLLCALLVGADALQLAALKPRAPMARALALRMADSEPPAEPDARAVYDAAVKAEGQVEAGQTVYDDEAKFVEKPPISSEMRAKLIKGQQQLGSDPNSQNPFLYVFGGVGVFVVLGAIAVNM